MIEQEDRYLGAHVDPHSYSETQFECGILNKAKQNNRHIEQLDSYNITDADINI